jgi:hypothetical protein
MISSFDQKPASGKTPARASVAITKHHLVIGKYFLRPPISRMSNVWWQAWLIEPAHRKRQALKKAWVKRWKMAPVHAPTPRAMTM